MKRIPAALMFLFFAFVITTSYSQRRPEVSDIVNVKDSDFNKAFTTSFPITRDTYNRYPDSMVIEGLVVDYIKAFACGVLCGCGVIKIKVINPHSLYKEPFVYVGMPCFEGMTDSLEKKDRWKLSKIPLNDKSCYWTEIPINKFDSKGVPFYTTDE